VKILDFCLRRHKRRWIFEIFTDRTTDVFHINEKCIMTIRGIHFNKWSVSTEFFQSTMKFSLLSYRKKNIRIDTNNQSWTLKNRRSENIKKHSSTENFGTMWENIKQKPLSPDKKTTLEQYFFFVRTAQVGNNWLVTTKKRRKKFNGSFAVSLFRSFRDFFLVSWVFKKIDWIFSFFSSFCSFFLIFFFIRFFFRFVRFFSLGFRFVFILAFLLLLGISDFFSFFHFFFLSFLSPSTFFFIFSFFVFFVFFFSFFFSFRCLLFSRSGQKKRMEMCRIKTIKSLPAKRKTKRKVILISKNLYRCLERADDVITLQNKFERKVLKRNLHFFWSALSLSLSLSFTLFNSRLIFFSSSQSLHSEKLPVQSSKITFIRARPTLKLSEPSPRS